MRYQDQSTRLFDVENNRKQNFTGTLSSPVSLKKTKETILFFLKSSNEKMITRCPMKQIF